MAAIAAAKTATSPQARHQALPLRCVFTAAVRFSSPFPCAAAADRQATRRSLCISMFPLPVCSLAAAPQPVALLQLTAEDWTSEGCWQTAVPAALG